MCDDAFESADKLFSHINNYRLKSDTIYECTVGNCFSKFHLRRSYNKHMVKHFNDINKPQVLDVCTESNAMECDDNSVVFEEHTNNVEYINNNQDNLNLQSESILISENYKPNPTRFEYDKNLREICDSAAKFATKLHSFNNLPRSDVNKITKLVQDLILNPVLQFIEQCQNPVNYIEKPIANVVADVKNLFENVKSDFKLVKYLKNSDLIGTVKSFKIKNNPKSSGTLMPLEFQLKKIFERNDYLDEVLTHIKNTETDTKYINFVQGNLWKQKKSLYPNKILIPFFLYADDFAINNQIGPKSNRHSTCNFYYSFPCVPQKTSKLSNVFLACTLKSSDIKLYGNCCFEPLVNMLIKLETEGVDIITKDGIKHVHFIMGLFLGDNLGLNVTLGFAKSFSSNYYCRFCLVKKSEAQIQSTENLDISRNRINYRESIERGLMSENGISSVCIFNDIPSFHCTENYAVDVMHDLFEGVCHLVLSQSILHFINTMKYFTIKDLNERLQTFKYDKHDRGDEKLTISMSELESPRLKLTAKQMMSLCQHFTVLIGDLIPNGDQVWKFLLLFFEMIDDVLCYEVSDALVNQIKFKIEKINKDFQLLFKKTLTPKFHFLLHYPTVLKQSGPLRLLWSFKFEGKHKEFKIYSHVITSRKNIPITFSFKKQMSFANFLLEKDPENDMMFKKTGFRYGRYNKSFKQIKNSSRRFSYLC